MDSRSESGADGAFDRWLTSCPQVSPPEDLEARCLQTVRHRGAMLASPIGRARPIRILVAAAAVLLIAAGVTWLFVRGPGSGTVEIAGTVPQVNRPEVSAAAPLAEATEAAAAPVAKENDTAEVVEEAHREELDRFLVVEQIQRPTDPSKRPQPDPEELLTLLDATPNASEGERLAAVARTEDGQQLLLRRYLDTFFSLHKKELLELNTRVGRNPPGAEVEYDRWGVVFVDARGETYVGTQETWAESDGNFGGQRGGGSGRQAGKLHARLQRIQDLLGEAGAAGLRDKRLPRVRFSFVPADSHRWPESNVPVNATDREVAFVCLLTPADEDAAGASGVAREATAAADAPSADEPRANEPDKSISPSFKRDDAKSPLAIAFDVRKDGMRIVHIAQPETFPYVVVTNASTKPLTLWRPSCGWGFRNLTVEVRDEEGRLIEETEARRTSTRGADMPQPFTLRPGEHLVFDVPLDRENWHMPKFDNTGGRREPPVYTLTAVFAIHPTDESQAHRVWTGRVATTQTPFEVRGLDW